MNNTTVLHKTILVCKARLAAIPLALALCLGVVALTAQAAIIPRLKNGENLKIAAIGTSLTNAGWSSWFEKTGDWLNSLPYAGKVTLDNQSIGGSYSQSGIDTQLPNALANNPDAVFIEFAINDAYTPYNVTQQKSRDNLQAIITTINDWGSENGKTVDIVVQTMNNVADINGWTGATDRPNLNLYYDGYNSVATDNHLLLIDNYPNWVNLYNGQSDHATWLSYVDAYGIHPNQLGTENVILPQIQRALLSEVPEPSEIALLAASLTGLLCYVFLRSMKSRRERRAGIMPCNFRSAWPVSLVFVFAGAFGVGLSMVEAAPMLTKLPGVYGTDTTEVTPILYQGQQILFQSHRPWPPSGGLSYLAITNLTTGQQLSQFGEGYSFGSAYVNGNQINVYATEDTSYNWTQDIYRFTSTDGINWSAPTLAIVRETGGHLFNSSVTLGPQGYVMAYEFNTATSASWNFKFARSPDLATWTKLDVPAFDGPTGVEMSACPAIRYSDGYYYAIYTTATSDWQYVPHLARSADLVTWQYGKDNPIMTPAAGEGINNSDVDLFEVDGKTYVFYLTGNQATWGNTQRAVYDGPMSDFLRSYFVVPEPSSWLLLGTAILVLLSYGWRKVLRMVALASLLAAGGMPEAFAAEPPVSPAVEKKLTKLPGVVESHVIECTPLLYQGRPIMFHSRRPMDTNRHAEVYLMLTDAESGLELARFGQRHSLGSAFVEGDTIHVFATEQPEGAAWFQDIQHFWSSDLKTWKRELAIPRAQGEEALLNSSVCRDEQGYLMAYESGQPVRWCFKFARSKDLAKWEKIPGLVFAGTNGKEMSACPVIRYIKPYYYVIYTREAIPPAKGWVPFLARSKDLATWELSPKNPIFAAGEGEGCNNSDVDLIEIDGKTYVYYLTGDQQTWGDLKRAVYPGPMSEFFESFFPKDSNGVEVSARGG